MLKYHLGQHVDEIAFAVLTKPYKEWDFYSESPSSEVISEAPCSTGTSSQKSSSKPM
jgi:hypothetical protein